MRARAPIGLSVFRTGLYVWIALAVLIALPTQAFAHALAPVALWVDQDGEELIVRVKRARLQPAGAVLRVRLPRSCEPVSPSTLIERSDHIIEQVRVHCDEPLVGSEFGMDGLTEAGLDAVVRVTLEDGRVLRGLLDRSDDGYVVPAQTSAMAHARAFVSSGLLHLLSGLDHVLLVIGLVLLLRRSRRVLVALTAFTVGHALSMAAAVFGLIVMPSALSEVAIALTLVWLAWEVVRRRQAESPVTQGALTRPYLASLGVGLVHGLGFATAFADAGLSDADLGFALGAFHLGIELGQLVVVVGALAVMALARRHRDGMSEAVVRQLAGYALGGIAFMWVIERTLSS